MDFASLMSSAMSKSAPQKKSTTSTSPSTTTTTSASNGDSNPAPTTASSDTSTPSTKSKYLKRSDLEAARESAYLAEQAAAAQARIDKAVQKRKASEEDAARSDAREEKRRRLAEESRARREEEEHRQESARRKRLGLPSLPAPGEEGGVGENAEGELEGGDMAEEELREKLRGLGEPAQLFGEGHARRVRRYRQLVAPKPVLSVGPIPTTLALLPEAEMALPALVSTTAAGGKVEVPAKGSAARELLLRKLASYFTLLLAEWARSLDARPTAVRETLRGRQAAMAMSQSLENLRPLFRLFEAGALEDEMLEPVVEIVRAAQSRRYVEANNKYLQLSIGKAAWPIGVVSVGIHERASRSRIGEERGNVAHIMGDEVSRRWLQAIKRCLTFAQTRWPPDDQMQLMG